MKQNTLDQAQEILKVTFKSPKLLETALTHKSAGSQKPESHYERLEFLGDRVLSLVMAETLLKVFPKEKEGEISRRHAALVNQVVLADIAQGLGLDKLIQADLAEKERSVQQPSILSDVMEAVIAAVYKDKGLQAAEAFILTHWEGLIETKSEAPKDAKTTLQEVAQAEGKALPIYRVVDKKGPDHSPLFNVAVKLTGMPEIMAHGASKRIAEQEAAQKALRMLNKL